MKRILLLKRPHDISLARLREQICRVYQTLNDVSVCYYFQRRKFQKHDYKIDQSIDFSQSTTYWVGELDNCIAAWLDINPYTWFK